MVATSQAWYNCSYTMAAKPIKSLECIMGLYNDPVFNKYLSYVRTVSYGPSLFPSISRLGHKSTGKNRGSVSYCTDREKEIGKICIISQRLIGRTGKETFKFSGPYIEIQRN